MLNLLALANLLEHFSTIWCMSAPQGDCDGAFWENGRWHLFRTPCNEVHQHKADVLPLVVCWWFHESDMSVISTLGESSR